MSFGPVAEAAAAEATDDPDKIGVLGAPAESPAPDSADLPDGPTDSPGGPSPPPGEVTSVYVPPTPILSTLPGERVPPVFENLGGEYRYTTIVGRYAFDKAKPYLLRYESREGEMLVAASTFIVLPWNVTLFEDVQVLEASQYRYAVQYGILSGRNSLGNVTITYSFRVDAAPKITARLSAPSPESLSLAWVGLTADTVAYNRTHTLNFRAVDPPVEIGAPEHRIFVGPGPDPGSWRRQVAFNWSDAGTAEVLVGRVSFRGNKGAAVLVKFPVGRILVDPTVVGTSSIRMGLWWYEGLFTQGLPRPPNRGGGGWPYNR